MFTCTFSHTYVSTCVNTHSHEHLHLIQIRMRKEKKVFRPLALSNVHVIKYKTSLFVLSDQIQVLVKGCQLFFSKLPTLSFTFKNFFFQTWSQINIANLSAVLWNAHASLGRVFFFFSWENIAVGAAGLLLHHLRTRTTTAPSVKT